MAKLAGKLEQEEQAWEVACGALQRSQEEASQRMDHEVARIQVPRGWHPGSQLGCGPEGPSGRDPSASSPAHVLPMAGSSLAPVFFSVASV